MGTFARSIGIIVASASSAAVLGFSGAPSAQAANQALFLNGLAAGELTQLAMIGILHGEFLNYGRTAVSWPEQARPYTGKNSLKLGDSIAIGVENLDAALPAALAKIGPGEHVTIVGLSAGALVADEFMRQLAASPDAPDKSKLNFVVVADGNHLWSSNNRYDKILDYTFQGPPVTEYDTTVVTGEYDGFADFPDRPLNLLADLNAVAGIVAVHVPTMLSNLDNVPAENITSTTNALGGVTTSYLIPAETLPLVKMLPFLKSQEAKLKKIIDKGYTRNDAKAASASSAGSSPVDTSVSTVAAAVADTGAGSEVSTPVGQPSGSVPAASSTAAKLTASPSKAGSRVAATAGGLGKGSNAGVNRRSNSKPAKAVRAAAATRNAG